MAVIVTMPQLGESVTEGTIGKWLKQPGDTVARYESIAEVITDKVSAEIPSPDAGIMGKILVAEGATVPVGEPLCQLETAASEPAKNSGAETPEASSAVAAVPPPPTPSAPLMPSPKSAKVNFAAALAQITPAVRALADEHNVDLSMLTGTGIEGRITKRDVLDYVDRNGNNTVSHDDVNVPVENSLTSNDKLIQLSPMRRAVAEHMVRSRHTSPHAWTMVEVDMTEVAALRAAQRDSFRQQHGIELTFVPFVARAVTKALQHFPSLNAVWSEGGIIYKGEINLSLAVALEDGLVVPVLHHIDKLDFAATAIGIAALVEKARQNRLDFADVQGGTFTLNNAGALGTVMSQAIINQPQAAILVMDAIVRRPVVTNNDAIEVHPIMNLCLSFDHRINDGLQAAGFLRDVKEALEHIGSRITAD